MHAEKRNVVNFSSTVLAKKMDNATGRKLKTRTALKTGKMILLTSMKSNVNFLHTSIIQFSDCLYTGTK